MGPIPLTQRMSELPLGKVPNAIADRGTITGRNDYRGDFDPNFRLRDLADPALAVAAREFQMQAHLLAASLQATVADRIGEEATRAIVDEAWLGVIVDRGRAPPRGNRTRDRRRGGGRRARLHADAAAGLRPDRHGGR